MSDSLWLENLSSVIRGITFSYNDDWQKICLKLLQLIQCEVSRSSVRKEDKVEANEVKMDCGCLLGLRRGVGKVLSRGKGESLLYEGLEVELGKEVECRGVEDVVDEVGGMK